MWMCAPVRPWRCGRWGGQRGKWVSELHTAGEEGSGEWVSDWASLTYVRTSDPSACGRRSAEFFWSANWELILGRLTTPHSLPFPSPATNGRTAGGRLRRPVVCHSSPPTILLWLELAATTTTSAVTVVVCMHASGGTKTTINTARLLGFHRRT